MTGLFPQQSQPRELFDYQTAAIENLREALRQGSRRPVLQAPTGCHAAGTPILMFDGTLKAVEDVVVGDRLMGPDSRPRHVMELHQGRDLMYEIRPKSGGDPFIVNRGHILSLQQTNLPEIDWRSIYNGEWRQISVGEYLQQTREFRWIHKLHRSTGISFVSEGQSLPLEPYLLGVLLGDGCFTNTVSVTTADFEIVDYLMIIAKQYGLTLREQISDWRTPNYYLTQGHVGGAMANPIMAALRIFGLNRTRSGTKFIPPCFKVASREDRLQILAGLLDTDGHQYNNGFDYVSKSPRLAGDVAFVARSLGLCVTQHTKTIKAGRYKGNVYHRLSITGHTNIVPTKIKRKQAGFRKQIKQPNITAFDVEALGDGDYYGFSVDDDHLYLLGDFTITHNSGKTKCAAEIVKLALGKGKRAVFTVPRISLVDQSLEAFGQDGVHDIGIIQASHVATDWSQPCQIASLQTLARRSLPEADLVIVDECHIRSQFLERWMAMPEWAKVPFIGLSATPWSKGLGRHFDRLIVVATTQQMIDWGRLSPFRCFAPSHPDLSGVKIIAGDYHEGQLSDRMNTEPLVADVVETWMRLGEGRPTLVFGVDRAHAKHLQERFLAAGISCGYQDAHTDLLERKLIRDKFHRGEYKVVANCETLTTGVDWDVRCLVLARPTRSHILYTQIVGRGLRIAPGKDHLILLDHSDTTSRLGFVTDIHFPCLDDGSGRSQQAIHKEPLPKECPQCHYLRPPRVSVCPSCGFKPEVRSKIQEEDGELVELTKLQKKRNKAGIIELQGKQIGLADFFGQLKSIAAKKGYKPGWASMKYKSATGVWPNKFKWAPARPISYEVDSWVRAQAIKWAKRQPPKGDAYEAPRERFAAD